MKRTLLRFAAMILVVISALSATITASAAVPYDSYTYWSDVGNERKEVYNRAMYEAKGVLGAVDFGVAPFTKICDIYVDDKDNLYLLDNSSRIVVLDANFKLIREIGLINGTESYDEASSIYVFNDGTIYICDTAGHRVLHITAMGELIDVITLPDSPLIPDKFDFKPTQIVRDEHDYLYVLSEGSYYGALIYDPDMEFLGFYGSNTVSATFTSVLKNISERMFPNNEKKGNTAQKLPYSFVDFTIDNKGFIYTCTGFTTRNTRKGQIRKLNPGAGTNILGSSDVNFVDTRSNLTYGGGSAYSAQDICSIAVDNNGFIYGLESAYGKVFVYDDSCRILTSFGGGMGEGTQVGTFVSATALAIKENGNKVLVCDRETNLITVFSITDFGGLVKKGISQTLAGDYEESKSNWEKVIKLDNNFQPAYSGLAKVYLNEKDYKTAIEYAQKGYDRETYALAFEYRRKEFLSENFTLIFIAVLLLLTVLIVFLVIKSKKKFKIIRNKEIRLLFATVFHPSNSFTDIKEKNLGSVTVCIMMVVLFYIATVLQTLAGGFLFTIYDAASFNSLWVLVRSAGLVLLWIFANWLVCTLLGGRGKLKEIAVVTCYSLLPLIVQKIISIVLTNVLLPSEASFLGIIETLAIIYFLIMMTIGLLKIHDFGMTRLVGTSALSVVGIGAIVFLIIMVVILVQQFIRFGITIVSEILTL